MRARARLAVRRARPFALRWSLATGVPALLALVLPFVAPDPGATDRAELERLAADTLRVAQRARTAEAAVTAAESLLAAARTADASSRRMAARPAVPSMTRPGATAALDPALTEFSRLLDEARRLRTPAALLAVAADPAVNAGPRMRALADTLRALAARRVPGMSAADSATLQRRIARTGVSILAIAGNRRADLLAATGNSALPEAPAPGAAPAAAMVAAPQAVVGPAADTIALVAGLAAARDSLARTLRVQDSLTNVLRVRASTTGTPPRRRAAAFVPALALLVLLILGLAARLGIALRAELEAPTLADASEAERLTGLRVLTTVRDALLDGPARFKPSGVDPFRMLYLGLTATGTRARTALVAGPDLEIAAATGARLAIAAAADHRNTLIVDVDASRIALSRTFHERAEPGLHDVLARAFAWREVARPVGSSDGLPITLLPAGTERDDQARGAELDALLADFGRFRGAYELTLAVAPLEEIDLAVALVSTSPILLTAAVGETSVDALVTSADALRTAGRKVHGLVLWDAPRPVLPTRAELAAEISRRKGRTPGGSFEAVRRAIDPGERGSKRP